MDIQVDEDFLNKIYNTYTWQGDIFIKALYNCCSYYYRCWTFCEMKETFCKTTSFWSVYFWIYKHQFLLIRFILKWNEYNVNLQMCRAELYILSLIRRSKFQLEIPNFFRLMCMVPKSLSQWTGACTYLCLHIWERSSELSCSSTALAWSMYRGSGPGNLFLL